MKWKRVFTAGRTERFEDVAGEIAWKDSRQEMSDRAEDSDSAEDGDGANDCVVRGYNCVIILRLPACLCKNNPPAKIKYYNNLNNI